VLQIFCETGFKLTRYARIMHDQIDLFIQSEGSVVEIRAADRREHSIDDYGFRMHESRLVLVNLFNCRKQQSGCQRCEQ
jgi:hypothetical protein